MSTWEITTLDQLIRIKHGFAFKGEFIQTEPNGVILSTPGNFRIGGGWQEEKCKYYSGPIPEDYILKGGELVVTMTDLSKEVDTLGYSALIPHNPTNTYLHNQRIGLVDIISAEVDFLFLYWLLRDERYRWHVVSSASGSTVSHTSPSRIGEYEFRLPPLPEQKAIASVLSSLDDKIDLLQRQNKTLEAMAETFFRKWFDDKEYTSSIGDIISLQNGYAFKSRDFEANGNNRVLKIKNISGGIVDISATDYIPVTVATNLSPRFRIATGDVLFAMTGAKIGKMGIIPESKTPLWLNQRVGLLKERYQGARFLAYLLLTSDFGKDYIENTATGSAQPNISGTGIEDCGFPLISEKQIIEYSKQLDILYTKLIANLGQIQVIENLRDTLLPKLMSGEILLDNGPK